jgi:hypothetical protein
VDVVMVDPRHRGAEFREGGKGAGAGGVASAMYNIASREMGYRLGHSENLTQRGAAFAKRVGGPTYKGRNPVASVGARIEIEEGGLNTKMLQGDLANSSTPLDPVVGRALTPTKQKQRRSRKPVQDQLPGEDWSKY